MMISRAITCMAVNQNSVLSCLAQVCPTKEPCCKGACRKPGDSATNLCRGMAAQACYKLSVVDSQPCGLQGLRIYFLTKSP